MIQRAAAIRTFIGRRTLDDYKADLMLRSAVERQFEILGEALARALRLDAGLRSLRPPPLGYTTVIGLLQITAFVGLVIVELHSAAAGKVAVLTYTMPFWLLLLACAFLGERPGRQAHAAAAPRGRTLAHHLADDHRLAAADPPRRAHVQRRARLDGRVRLGPRLHSDPRQRGGLGPVAVRLARTLGGRRRAGRAGGPRGAWPRGRVAPAIPG